MYPQCLAQKLALHSLLNKYVWIERMTEWVKWVAPDINWLGIFSPKTIYSLEKISGPSMKYVTCHLLPLPKDSNKYTKAERGKIFHLKGTERQCNNKKENILWPWSVPPHLSASSDEGNKEYGLPKMFQAVPARMCTRALTIVSKLLFQISR